MMPLAHCAPAVAACCCDFSLGLVSTAASSTKQTVLQVAASEQVYLLPRVAILLSLHTYGGGDDGGSAK